MDGLPAEILVGIAGNLQADDLWSFAATRKNIHSCCWDPLTFQSILENSQDQWQYQSLNLAEIQRRSSKDASLLALKYNCTHNYYRTWLNASRIFSPGVLTERYGLDTDILAKYAVADCKALRLCKSMDRLQMGPRSATTSVLISHSQEALAYIPQLFILKHPCLHAPGLSVLFWFLVSQLLMTSAVGGDAEESDESIEAAFAASACLASQDQPRIALSNRDIKVPTFETGMALLLQNVEASLDRPNGSIRSDHALLIVGIVSCLLRQAFRSYRVRRMIGSNYYSFLLPFVVEMPFDDNRSWVPIPIPFEADEACFANRRSWKRWLQACTSDSIKSIEESEWVGVYSYLSPKEHWSSAPAGQSKTEFDAPMEGIQFTVAGPKRSAADATPLHAGGVDSIGGFTLDGHVEANGAIRLSKRYGAGFSWEWRCRMTPFGIAGIWGRNTRSGGVDVLGSVWLWQRRWTVKGED